MGAGEAAGAPYHAVVALFELTRRHFRQLNGRYEAEGGIRSPIELLDQPLRRILEFTYGVIAMGMDKKKLEEWDNLLERPPDLETSLIPGIPIPAWFPSAALPKATVRQRSQDVSTRGKRPRQRPESVPADAPADKRPPPQPL